MYISISNWFCLEVFTHCDYYNDSTTTNFRPSLTQTLPSNVRVKNDIGSFSKKQIISGQKELTRVILCPQDSKELCLSSLSGPVMYVTTYTLTSYRYTCRHSSNSVYAITSCHDVDLG